MNKQWRSIFLLAGIFALGIILLWWLARQKTPEKPKMPTQVVQESRSFRFFDTIEPLVKPFEALIPSSNLDITPSNPPYFKGEEQSVPHLKVRRGEGELSNGVRGVMEKPLSSSDPIFKKLYPSHYLDALSVLHRVMVNDGFLADTSFAISDEDALFAFLSSTVDYAETKNFIAQTDAERFREALHGETRELLRKERYSFLYQILNYFNISNVFASIVTGPECYSDPYPFNIIPGVNLPFNFCCNCGLICTKVGPPIFVPDCSVKSCDVPLGCLNLICPNGNAIWDPLTGICGCDNPVSAAQNIPSILENALNCIAPNQPAPPPLPPPPPPPSTP